MDIVSPFSLLKYFPHPAPSEIQILHQPEIEYISSSITFP